MALLMPVMAGNPHFFPSLYGSGSDGDLTATNQSDVGHLVFGAKQYMNLTIPAGVTWTIGRGTSSGAMLISCKGQFTLAGTITGTGENAVVATTTTSGGGGATAGGGATIAGVTASGAAANAATRYGHGAKQNGWSGSGESGYCGTGRGTGGSTGVAGNGSKSPTLDTSTAQNLVNTGRLLQLRSSTSVGRVSPRGLTATSWTFPTGGNTPTRDTSSDVGPWAQAANTLWLPQDMIPAAPSGHGGGINYDGTHFAGGGGGGGGGGIVIVEARSVTLTAGYSVDLSGGNGSAGAVNGGGDACGGGGGYGGIMIIVCQFLTGSTGAITCNGGSAGAGAGSGQSGLAGVAGGVYVIRV